MKHDAGFTLIELLVAISIFVILAAAMYGGTEWIIAERDIVNQRTAQLESLQRAVRMLQSDFGQAWPRAVRDELGRGETAALLSDRASGLQIELTRSGWRNPGKINRSSLQRVRYRYDDEKDILYRATWPVLDRLLGTDAREKELLDGVNEFEVEFLDDAGNWVQDWPTGSSGSLTSMPRALRYRIESTEFGSIERLVEVPG